jgi:hypothetical protein
MSPFLPLDGVNCPADFDPHQLTDETMGGDMSLVLAARANDGVVVVTDERSATSGQYGYYSDDAMKAVMLQNGVIIGFAGPGQWAEALLAKQEGHLSRSGTAADVAQGLLDVMEPTFPDVAWTLASAKPQPMLVRLERKLVGGMAAWPPPLVHRGRWLASGIVQVFAEFYLPTMLAEDTPIEVAAAILLLVHHMTASVTCFVSPAWHMFACRTNGERWTKTDQDGAEQLARQMLVNAREAPMPKFPH